jgi:hypothetical protein
MPWRAMQKFSFTNGCMLRCGWLPPVFVFLAGVRVLRDAAGPYALAAFASRSFPARFVFASNEAC